MFVALRLGFTNWISSKYC